MGLRAYMLPLIVCTILFGRQDSAAGTSDLRDLQVVARSLKFLGKGPGPQVVIGVVTDPKAPDESAVADGLLRLIDGRLRSGTTNFSGRVIEVGALDAMNGVDLVFVPPGLGAHQAEVFAAARERGLMTVSTDQTCVDNGYCVMWVKAEPSVRIVVHRAAAEASDIRFDTSFRMLVTER